MKKTQFLLSGLFLLALLVLGFVFLNRWTVMPVQDLGPISCVSYAPFVGAEAPWQFDQGLEISEDRFRNDLNVLSKQTQCVRTYSVTGMDKLFPILREKGFKIWFGIWIGADQKANEKELQLAEELIQKYSDIIHVVIVGNEVLLRREQKGADLVKYIERVRRVSQGLPLTYADVWEFWQKNPEVAKVVDVVTIHILPYWENEPIAVEKSREHIEKIFTGVSEQFPHKKIAIGEMGWPSRGRSREVAVASSRAQYEFLDQSLKLCAEKSWDCNVIEAFDQPWKRHSEGGVGGAWGVWDEFRQFKMNTVNVLPPHQLVAMFIFSALFLLVAMMLIWPKLGAMKWPILLLWCVSSLVLGLVQGYAYSDYVFYTRTAYEFIWHSVLWILPVLFWCLSLLREEIWHKGVRFSLNLFLILSLSVLLGLVVDGRYRFFPVATWGATVLWLRLMPWFRQRFFSTSIHHMHKTLSVPILICDFLLMLSASLFVIEKITNTQAVLMSFIVVCGVYSLPRVACKKIRFVPLCASVVLLMAVVFLRLKWWQSDALGEFCRDNLQMWECHVRSLIGYMIHFHLWGAVAVCVTALTFFVKKSFWLNVLAFVLSLVAMVFYNVDQGALALGVVLVSTLSLSTEYVLD